MFWPCETRTSICRNLATISSGLYRFLAITVLLDVKDIPQVGPLQWGWITATLRRSLQACISSLPLQSSLMSKTYLKSDHFSGGGSPPLTLQSASGLHKRRQEVVTSTRVAERLLAWKDRRRQSVWQSPNGKAS